MNPKAELRMNLYLEGKRAYKAGAQCPYSDCRRGTWQKGFNAAKDQDNVYPSLEEIVCNSVFCADEVGYINELSNYDFLLLISRALKNSGFVLKTKDQS